MKQPARILRLKGEVTSRNDADALLAAPGDGVIVRRGVLRSLVISCPDGCGDVLTINLDPRSGPSWRLYRTRRGLSLYPSVWRDSGCESHFILWSNKILWCGIADDDSDVSFEPTLEAKVLEALSKRRFISYQDIAEKLDEVPWEVARACRSLVDRSLAEAGRGNKRDSYRRL